MLAFFMRMFGKLGGWLGLSTVAAAGVEVAKWAAWKVLLAAFWFIGVYILINNGFVLVMNLVASYMPQVYGGSAPTTSLGMQLTGIGAYLAQKLMLVDSFTAFMSGLSLAVVRTFLPWPIGK